MSFMSNCKDALSQVHTWMGISVSLVVAFLSYLDPFALSLIGVHSESGPQAKGASGDPPQFYTPNWKDPCTILAYHLPLYIIFSITWDVAGSYPSGAARTRFCFYLTSGLMLASCLFFDTIGIFKEGYWTAFDEWWNGVPDGHLPYWVKLYFLVQSALLSYFLATLVYSRLSIASMLDTWVDGALNLTFSIFCYLSNLIPLMMVVFSLRFCIQSCMSLVQVVSLLELSGKRRDCTRFLLRGLRLLTGAELICYVALILASVILGSNGLFVKVPTVGFLGLMSVASGIRVFNGSKFDMDQLRAGDGGQAPGAGPQPAAAPKSRSKSRK